MKAALTQRPNEVRFKRLERDREYRVRLVIHPKATGLLLEQARVFHGAALDGVGALIDCPRRIIEDEA